MRSATRTALRHYGTTISATLATILLVTGFAIFQQQQMDRIRAAQVDSCERGNIIRAQLAEDNQQQLATLRRLLGAPGLTSAQRAAYTDAIARRHARARDLFRFPCDRIKD